jgi:hypothetical protein
MIDAFILSLKVLGVIILSVIISILLIGITPSFILLKVIIVTY